MWADNLAIQIIYVMDPMMIQITQLQDDPNHQIELLLHVDYWHLLILIGWLGYCRMMLGHGPFMKGHKITSL